MKDAYKKADDVLLNAVRSIFDLVVNRGHINLDFADIRTVMKDAGTAMMGIGYGTGENRALDAATQAINSNLLEASIQGASRVLFSNARNDLFASTAPARETYTSNQSHPTSPVATSAGSASTRIADEEYIPDFLRRR